MFPYFYRFIFYIIFVPSYSYTQLYKYLFSQLLQEKISFTLKLNKNKNANIIMIQFLIALHYIGFLYAFHIIWAIIIIL